MDAFKFNYSVKLKNIFNKKILLTSFTANEQSFIIIRKNICFKEFYKTFQNSYFVEHS